MVKIHSSCIQKLFSRVECPLGFKASTLFVGLPGWPLAIWLQEPINIIHAEFTGIERSKSDVRSVYSAPLSR